MYKKQKCDEAIVFNLPNTMKAEAQHLSKSENIPMAEIMREALDAYLSKRRKVKEVQS